MIPINPPRQNVERAAIRNGAWSVLANASGDQTDIDACVKNDAFIAGFRNASSMQSILVLIPKTGLRPLPLGKGTDSQKWGCCHTQLYERTEAWQGCAASGKGQIRVKATQQIKHSI
jgi:hypothetical protein